MRLGEKQNKGAHELTSFLVSSTSGQDEQNPMLNSRGGGRGVLLYMGYIGLCGLKGYGFSAILVINRVSILADFGYFGHK